MELPGDDLRLYIVNDGSSHGVSPDEVGKLQSGIPHMRWITYPENHGKGYALRHGVRQTDAPFIIYTDIDMPYTIESMTGVVEALRQGANLAVGARDADYYSQIPASRKWISTMLKTFNKTVFGLRVPDTQCGLKGLDTRGRAVLLQTTINRYLFDLELVMEASRDQSLRLDPVPVYLEPGVTLSPVSAALLLREVRNLGRLFIKRWF